MVNDELNSKVKSEIERILRENWTVDGPFVTTLDEVASQVMAEFKMPRWFLLELFRVLVVGAEEILDRRDKEEMARLVARMYFCGLLQGVRWQREGRTK